MTYYDYAFQTNAGEEALLRFAMRNSDQKVDYISARLTRYEKAKAQSENKAKEAAQTQAQQSKDQYMKADGKELPFR